MGDYHILDSDGYVVRGGYCTDGCEASQANDGETVVIGRPTKGSKRRGPKRISYAELRRRAYPAIEDLADAIVKSRSDDEDVKEQGEIALAEYAARCLAVKVAIPKTATADREFLYDPYLDGDQE